MAIEQETDDPETMILQKCLLSKPINNLILINYFLKITNKGNDPSFPTRILSVTVKSFHCIDSNNLWTKTYEVFQARSVSA